MQKSEGFEQTTATKGEAVVNYCESLATRDLGSSDFCNDGGYYCRQIDFRRKYPFSRNYGDSLAGQIVFPIYDSNVLTTGLVGRHPGNRGVRWRKHQTREVPLSDKGWLCGIEKAIKDCVITNSEYEEVMKTASLMIMSSDCSASFRGCWQTAR